MWPQLLCFLSTSGKLPEFLDTVECLHWFSKTGACRWQPKFNTIQRKFNRSDIHLQIFNHPFINLLQKLFSFWKRFERPIQGWSCWSEHTSTGAGPLSKWSSNVDQRTCWGEGFLVIITKNSQWSFLLEINKNYKQAGTELCKAQEKLGLAKKLALTYKKLVVYHFAK